MHIRLIDEECVLFIKTNSTLDQINKKVLLQQTTCKTYLKAKIHQIIIKPLVKREFFSKLKKSNLK